jgi:hypothetical protein
VTANQNTVAWSGSPFRCGGRQGFQQYKQAQLALPDLKQQILLDTGSAIRGTFMNPDLMKDIKPAKYPIGMTTNANTDSPKKLSVEGDKGLFGTLRALPEVKCT